VHNGYVDWAREGFAADVYRNSIKVQIEVGAITFVRSFASPVGDY